MSSKKEDQPVVWFDPKGLEREYGFSISNQGTLRSKGILPHSKRGNYIRYKKSDIDTWLDNGKVV